MGEERIFKRAVFGGFKRKAVIDYIVELKNESVETSKKLDSLESENKLLAEQLKRARDERDRVLSGSMAAQPVPSVRGAGECSAAGHLSLEELDLGGEGRVERSDEAPGGEAAHTPEEDSPEAAAPVPTASAMSKFDLFSAQILGNPVISSAPAEDVAAPQAPDEDASAPQKPDEDASATDKSGKDSAPVIDAPIPTASAMSKFDLFSAQILGNPVIPSAPAEETSDEDTFETRDSDEDTFETRDSDEDTFEARDSSEAVTPAAGKPDEDGGDDTEGDDTLLAAQRKIERLMARIYEVGDVPFSFDAAKPTDTEGISAARDGAPQEDTPPENAAEDKPAKPPRTESEGASPGAPKQQKASPAPARGRVAASERPASSAAVTVRRRQRDGVKAKPSPSAETRRDEIPADIDKLIDFFSSSELK